MSPGFLDGSPGLQQTLRSNTFVVNTYGSIAGVYFRYKAEVSPDSLQYSDSVSLRATIYPIVPSQPMPENVHFYVGSQDVGSAGVVIPGQYASLTTALTETTDGELAAGSREVTAKWDNNDSWPDPTTTLLINKEDAVMTFESTCPGRNPAEVQVRAPWTNSAKFTFEVHIEQSDDGFPGDIDLIRSDNVSISLAPVEHASVITQTASSIFTDASGARIVTFTFWNVPVDTYEVTVTLDNGYFTASPIMTALSVYKSGLERSIGGEVIEVTKPGILAPWLALYFVVCVGGILLSRKH